MTCLGRRAIRPGRISTRKFSITCWTLINAITSDWRFDIPMKNPPHPGVLSRQCIEPLGLTITDAAAALGVTRTTLSELVNGKRGTSPKWR